METTAFGGSTASAGDGGVVCWAHALLATSPVTKRTVRRSIGVFLVAACCSCGGVAWGDRLERDDFSSNRHLALSFCLSTIFSENRHPPRIKCGAGFFRIML